MNVRGPLFVRFAVVALLLVAAGCGVSEPSRQTWTFTGIGPEGGTLQAGDVYLAIPAGALTEPTAVDIAPQADPLPITAVDDPCTYAFLGPIWCCGPVGQDLNVPAFVRLAYDESLIPAGHAESDLVLLLWDDAAQTLRPVTTDVHQDTAGNFFQTSDYTELGHLAVGVRTCSGPLRPIVLVGETPQVALTSSVYPQVLLADGLYLASANNSLPLEPLATNGEVPDAFVPSQDGTRVLYRHYIPASESTVLRTVAPGDAGPTTVVGTDRSVAGGDPLLGWYRDATRVYFYEWIAASQGSYSLSQVPGDGSAGASVLYGMSSFTYLYDIRQSDDGSRILLVIATAFTEFSQAVVVIDGATGSEISAGLIPLSAGAIQTPRFVPGSTDVYGIAGDRRSVARYADDGTFVETIYALDAQDPSSITDFVLAPDADGYAAVLGGNLQAAKAGGATGGVAATIGGNDTLEAGTLSGGFAGATDLGSQGAFLREMAFHPNGGHVLLDMNGVRVFRASDAALESTLPVASMSDVDVSTLDGRLLLVVGTLRLQALAQEAVTIADGLYVAAADGTGLFPIDTQNLTVRAARWLFGIRNSPGMTFSGIR